MAIKWTTINIPLGQGIDTKTDAKALPPGKLEELENEVFSERISLKKRYGTEILNQDLTDGGALTAVKSISSLGDELLAFSDDTVYGYAEGPEKWVDIGALTSVGVTNETVAYLPSEQTNADFASANGITAYAWQDSRGGVRFTVYDTDSKTTLVADKLASSTGIRPRCIGFGGHVHILYVETAGNRILNKRISSTNPSSTADEDAITVVDNINASLPNYDVTPYGNYAALTYLRDDDQVALGFIAVNGEIGSPGNGGFPALITPVSSAGNRGLALATHPADGSLLLVVSTAPAGMSLYTYDNLLNQVGTAVVSTATIGDIVSGNQLTACYEQEPRDDGYYHAQIFWSIPGADSWNGYTKCLSYRKDGSSIINVTPGDTMRHATLASHAFSIGPHVYVNLVHDSPLQATYFTVRSDFHVVAKHLPGNAGSAPSEDATLPSVYTDDEVVSWVGTFKNRLPVETGTGDFYAERGIKRFDLDFDYDHSHRTVNLGSSQYITGGFLSLYDGEAPVESGFHLYPENIQAVASTTASGSLTPDTQVRYRCFWEWFTADGERELSTTASGINVALGASDDTVTLTVPTLAMTAKKPGNRAGVRLAVTRTLGNGTTRFRVDDPSNPVWNNPSVDSITFVDTMADEDLAKRELDYTNAEFDHTAPPSASIITASKERIFLAGLPDPYTVRYSKISSPGNAAAFYGGFTLPVDQKGGPITAIATLDDKVVVFKETRIFVFTGDGPDNAGLAGDNFSPPQLVTSDVGCSNQRSLVEMPNGLMFQTDKGIYLLDRNLQLAYIGADVEAFNDQTITSATVLPDRNLVVFLTNGSHTLVYDYLFNQWTTFTNFNGIDSTLWNGVFTMAKSDGDIRYETVGSYKDIDSPISGKMVTGWIHLAGPQGYARIKNAYLLGSYKSTHTLRVKIAYDYEPFYSHTITWKPDLVLSTAVFGVDTAIGDTDVFGGGTGIFGGSKSSVYQVKLEMPIQKAQAVKFLFEDIPGNPPGESFELNQLTLTVGNMGGAYRLPTEKTTG